MKVVIWNISNDNIVNSNGNMELSWMFKYYYNG